MTHQRTTYRLEGNQANLQAIRKKVNRVVRGNRLCRLELRVSSQAHPPINLGQARTALMDLLRERGLNQVAVSVRPFELALEDGLGEHQLVLVETPKPPSVWAQLATWLHSAFKSKHPRSAAAPERLEPNIQPGNAVPVLNNLPKPTGPSRQEVSRLIKRASLLALRDMPVDEAGHWTVEHIHVRIRSAELCVAASPLLPSVASVFVQWMAREAQRSDLQTSPSATVLVEQLPGAGSEAASTVLVGEGDLSISLRATPPDNFMNQGTDLP
jgi:hypothetical protein